MYITKQVQANCFLPRHQMSWCNRINSLMLINVNTFTNLVEHSVGCVHLFGIWLCIATVPQLANIH